MSGGERVGDSVYQSPRWRELRREVLADEPICRICLRAPATEVDHIIAIAVGGAKWNRLNLRAVCSPCHKRKGRGRIICDHGYHFVECERCKMITERLP